MLKYIIIFLIFSILGWIYEYILFNRRGPDDILNIYFNIKLPFITLYGLAGVLLILIYENTKEYSMIIKLLITFIVLNLLECWAGLYTYGVYGFQAWKYDYNRIPFCYGYISIITGLWWTFLSFIIFKGLELLS